MGNRVRRLLEACSPPRKDAIWSCCVSDRLDSGCFGPQNAIRTIMADVSRVVVIGASAGGLEPLVTIARSLTPKLDAALFVVLHSSPKAPSLLADILTRSGSVPATFASDGETIRRSRIYVAPP